MDDLTIMESNIEMCFCFKYLSLNWTYIGVLQLSILLMVQKRCGLITKRSLYSKCITKFNLYITWKLGKSGSLFYTRRYFLFYTILPIKTTKLEVVFKSLDLGNGKFSSKADLQRKWSMIKCRYWSHVSQPLWICLSKISLVFHPKPVFP